MFLTLCLDDRRVEVTRRFYERLGLKLSLERHGDKGLPHYAEVMPHVPVEIYPTIKSLPPGDRLFIGFEVDDPVALGNELVEHFEGRHLDPPVQVTASGIAVLRDPNGLLVRLFPKSPLG